MKMKQTQPSISQPEWPYHPAQICGVSSPYPADNPYESLILAVVRDWLLKKAQLGLIVTALLVGATSSANAQSFTVTGLTSGNSVTFAQGINDAGQVVGYSISPGGPSAATLWSGGSIINLAPLPGYTSSFAYGINNAGQVVGVSQTTRGTASEATLWSGGSTINLGTLGGANS